MCAGALVWSRMEKLVIGTMDPKSGGCGSIFNITGDNRLNHQVQVETGLLEECDTDERFFQETQKSQIENRRNYTHETLWQDFKHSSSGW